MLNKYVRVKVVNAIKSQDENGFIFPLNYGIVENSKNQQGAYIMGIHHPVQHFDGRVIGCLFHKITGQTKWVIAPKSTRFINNDICNFLDMQHEFSEYRLECLYESSCGAVIYSEFNNETRFLLIKNKRSTNWGFPKGHVEVGETEERTARREVMEETGLKIDFIPGFSTKSEYKIQGKIEKSVVIFLAKAASTLIKLQVEEIDDYVWQTFSNAYNTLHYEKDKTILEDAYQFLVAHQLINKPLQ